jgi:ketosteroid isomerase-like protein
MMSNHENLETVKRLYAAFGAADMQTILGLLDAGVSWSVPGRAPWSGEGSGVDHVGRFFQSFGASAAIQAFEPRTFVADGDQVVVLGYEEGTARATGRAWKSHFTHVFTVAGGKITAHREYVDTHAIAEAFRA